MTNTQTRLEEIRERCEKADPAPWFFDGDNLLDQDKSWLIIGDDLLIRDSVGAFIAASRSDVPWLLELVDELRMNAAAVVDYHKGWDLQAKQERVFVSLELLTNLRDTLAKVEKTPPDLTARETRMLTAKGNE